MNYRHLYNLFLRAEKLMYGHLPTKVQKYGVLRHLSSIGKLVLLIVMCDNWNESQVYHAHAYRYMIWRYTIRIHVQLLTSPLQ